MALTLCANEYYHTVLDSPEESLSPIAFKNTVISSKTSAPASPTKHSMASSSAVAPLSSRQQSTSRSNSLEAATASSRSSSAGQVGGVVPSALSSSSASFSSSIIFPLSDAFLHHPSLSRFLSTSLGSSIFFNRLLSGSIFLKHGNHGSPHYRYVWTSEDLQHIYWGDLKTRKIHGSLLCDSLKAVYAGHHSRIFQERAPKGCDAKKCFSLENAQRTLDLEAISEEERDIWVLTFQFLLEFFHVMRAEPDEKVRKSMLQQAIQIASGEKKATVISAIEALIEDTNDSRDTEKKENDKNKEKGVEPKNNEPEAKASTAAAAPIATQKTILTETNTMQTLQNAAPAADTRHPLNNAPNAQAHGSTVGGGRLLSVVAPAHGPSSTMSLTPSAPPSVVSSQSAARVDPAPLATSSAAHALQMQVHPMSMTQPMPYRSINSLANNPSAALAALSNVAAYAHASQASLPNVAPMHDRSLSLMSSSSSAGSSVAAPPTSSASPEIYSVAALYQSLEETKRRIEAMESDVERYKDGNKKLVLSSAKKMIKFQESIDQLMYENEILRKQLNMPPLEDAEMEKQIKNHLYQQDQNHDQTATQHQSQRN